MIGNAYDNDITTWSPQGRLHQIEYAMEAVKQGTPCVGAKSKTHAVICALQRSASKLSSYQPKIFEVDSHTGVAISGLTADARVLSKWLRTESLNYKFVYEGQQPLNRLVRKLADKSQVVTQRYGARPYGVGLLIVGYDQAGPHLFETDPAGNFFDFKAQAIGNRSQSARTYLERHFESFPDESKDALIKHGLKALRETLVEKKNEKDREPDTLDTDNCVVGVVGKEGFILIKGDALQPYLNALDQADAPVDAMDLDK